MLEEYHALFIGEIKRRLIGECQERTLKCLDLLTEEEIWHRPNDLSNSVGNLVLHLCGNVRQWLFSTVGGQEDVRERQLEFEASQTHAREELKSMIKELMRQADEVLTEISPHSLLDMYRVQGFQESGVAILIHVAEHFSYHVGQITYFVKAHGHLDPSYYDGIDLNATK